jgi:hypothetical protein
VILDDMEARLAGHRQALDEGSTPPGPVVVPDGTGPLPPALRARAAAVLDATRHMEAEVEIRRDAVRGAMCRAALDGGRQGAAYVDAHA